MQPTALAQSRAPRLMPAVGAVHPGQKCVDHLHRDLGPALDQLRAPAGQLGPQYAILETDLGQVNNEPAPDGLAAFIMNLRAKGFTKAETDMMTKTNPAKLFGLTLPAGSTQ